MEEGGVLKTTVSPRLQLTLRATVDGMMRYIGNVTRKTEYRYAVLSMVSFNDRSSGHWTICISSNGIRSETLFCDDSGLLMLDINSGETCLLSLVLSCTFRPRSCRRSASWTRDGCASPQFHCYAWGRGSTRCIRVSKLMYCTCFQA